MSDRLRFSVAAVGPIASAERARYRGLVEKAAGDLWTKEAIASELESDRAGLYVVSAEPHGPIGFAFVSAVLGEAEVLLIGVLPELRRTGAGRALIEGLKASFSVIHLEVREQNLVARRFYEALGFVETGRRKRYYDGKDDAVLMAWRG